MSLPISSCARWWFLGLVDARRNGDQLMEVRMAYLINALPGAIVPRGGIKLSLIAIKPNEVPQDVISALGHADTAVVVSSLVGREIPMNRISTPEMSVGDVNFVVLYKGPRLAEGAITLPEGAELNFFKLIAEAPDAA